MPVKKYSVVFPGKSERRARSRVKRRKCLKTLVRGAGFETTQSEKADDADVPDVIDISKLKKVGE